MDGDYLKTGAILGAICAVPTFIGAWWYCAATYGFLLGFGLGWLPAAIAAALVFVAVAVLWPFIVLAIAALIYFAVTAN